MKLTTQRLKKLIKEELEGLEETSGQMVYVIFEVSWAEMELQGTAYMSKEAAEAKVQELNKEKEEKGENGKFHIEEVKLMD